MVSKDAVLKQFDALIVYLLESIQNYKRKAEPSPHVSECVTRFFAGRVAAYEDALEAVKARRSAIYDL